MYFKYFPYTYYTLDNGRTVQLITNNLLRVVFSNEIKNNYALYDEYDVVDGETPEIVADRFYNNAQLHWIILHANEIIDPRFDWPLSTNNLIRFCQGKYADIDAVHHYENSEGLTVDSDVVGATPISNFQYEDRLNEQKRRIRVLKPVYVDTIIKDFANRLKE